MSDDPTLRARVEAATDITLAIEQAAFAAGVKAERAKLPKIINTVFQDGVQEERRRTVADLRERLTEYMPTDEYERGQYDLILSLLLDREEATE